MPLVSTNVDVNTMKKSIVITILIILLVALLIWGYLYLLRQDNATITEEGPENFPSSGNADPADREELRDFFTDTDGDGTADIVEAGALFKISEGPVAGSVIFDREISATTTETFARYVERGTGHVYEAKLPQGVFKRIANTTIPKTVEAIWSPTGESVLIRYEDETGSEILKNFLVKFPENQQEGVELEGGFLAENIFSPHFSPSGEELAYIRNNVTGADIIVHEVSSESSSIIYTSPVREWLVNWVNSSTLLVSTKPSNISMGFAYTLSSGGGGLSKLAGGLRGLLTTVSPDEEAVVLTISSGTDFESFLKEQGERVPLPASSLPDKCKWSVDNTLFCGVPVTIPANLYPDSWYMGLTSFTDTFWKMRPQEGQSEILSIPDEEIDAINLSVNNDNSFLTFENKKDHSLWLLVLSSSTLE